MMVGVQRGSSGHHEVSFLKPLASKKADSASFGSSVVSSKKRSTSSFETLGWARAYLRKFGTTTSRTALATIASIAVCVGTVGRRVGLGTPTTAPSICLSRVALPAAERSGNVIAWTQVKDFGERGGLSCFKYAAPPSVISASDLPHCKFDHENTFVRALLLNHDSPLDHNFRGANGVTWFRV